MQDIHTHLYWKSYDPDREAVIARARERGVEKMFVIGCTLEESRQAVALAEEYSGLYAAVGIHPHEFSGQPVGSTERLAQTIQELRVLAQDSKKVVAIGECGLDYFVRPTPSGAQKAFVGRSADTLHDGVSLVQKAGFLAQAELALELGLPLIVHCRPSLHSQDAYEQLFAMLRDQAMPICILHCYMGDTVVTEQFLTLPNVHFSFTANITYPVKKSLRGTQDDLTESVKLIPLERIFTETDCPFLAPQSHRGERNEPAFVAAVLEKIAQLHGVPVRVAEQTLATHFQAVFPKL